MKEYLTSMVGCVFKLLPLYEDNNEGLPSYINSISIQLIGALDTYPELKSDYRYISVVNSINFFNGNEYTKTQLKHEVFRCIQFLQKIIDE